MQKNYDKKDLGFQGRSIQFQMMVLTCLSFLAFPIFFAQIVQNIGLSPNMGNLIGLVIGSLTEFTILRCARTPERLARSVHNYRDFCFVVFLGSALDAIIRSIIIRHVHIAYQ